jgi:hypothetical protein
MIRPTTTSLSLIANENNEIECKLNVVEQSNKYNECLDKIIGVFNKTLNNDYFKFINEDDIEVIITKFLNIFNIEQYEKYDYNTLQQCLHDIDTYTKELIQLYKDEFEFNVHTVCDIFDIMGNTRVDLQNKLQVINWKNKYENPIYILFDDKKKIVLDFNGNNLSTIMSKLKNMIFTVNNVPPLSEFNCLQNSLSSCMQTIKTDLFKSTSPDIINIQNSLLNLEKQYPFLEINDDIIYNNFGQGCEQENLINKQYKLPKTLISDKLYKMISNIGVVIQQTKDLMYEFINILLNLLHKIAEYKRIREKMHNILNLFEQVIVCTTNVSLNKNIILQKIIVLVVDRMFFKFGYNFFIQQLKVDTYNKLSIERILTNIANFYYESSVISDEYLILSEQEDKVKINILLFIYMFIIKLSEIKSFYIPFDNKSNYLNTVNLALIVCMTMRDTIICPNDDIQKLIINKIIDTTKYYDTNIFTVQNNKIIDIYGKVIVFQVNNLLTDKIILQQN